MTDTTSYPVATTPWRAIAALVAAIVLMLPVAPVLAQGQDGGAQPEAIPRVDLNAAGVDELEEIPGVGPTLARRIVEFRDEFGPFESVDDLLNVRGIGVRSLERMRPYVFVQASGERARLARGGLRTPRR